MNRVLRHSNPAYVPDTAAKFMNDDKGRQIINRISFELPLLPKE